MIVARVIENVSFQTFLNTACSCGLVTWKTRSVGGTTMAPSFDKDHASSVFVHILKESVLQRVFCVAV